MNDLLAIGVWAYLQQQRDAELEAATRRQRMITAATERTGSAGQTGGERRFRWPVFARRTPGVRTA